MYNHVAIRIAIPAELQGSGKSILRHAAGLLTKAIIIEANKMKMTENSAMPSTYLLYSY